MRGSMKNMFKNIDWLEAFLSLMIIFSIGLFIFIIITIELNTTPEYRNDITRKNRICKTYSNDFWRNDIDFIDGKCYYKGKEVEIK